MKSLVIMMVALSIGLGLSINPVQKEISYQKAEAGIGLVFIPFAFREYRNFTDEVCNPANTVGEFFGCIFAILFGEEDEISEDATTWLSQDHPYVKTGVETRGGETVQYDEQTRKSHNRLVDVFVDYLEDFRAEMEAEEFSADADADDVMDRAENVAKKFMDKKDFAKHFETEADVQALKNFLKIQFGFSLKAESSDKE